MSVTTEGATRSAILSQVYVTGLACVMASDVTGLACVMASVRQMSQVWHVSWRLCVRCHRFGMCHGVCASDVTGLACVMASVRQMSQVWHVSWCLCVRCHRFGMCHGVCASDVMSRNVKNASPLVSPCHVTPEPLNYLVISAPASDCTASSRAPENVHNSESIGFLLHDPS